MPLVKDRVLFEQVESATEDAFWWLGQHSFIVKLNGTVLLIDPFLSEVEGRRVPPLFSPEDATGIVDLVLCTHDHLDHIDPAAIPGLAQHTSAMFVAPRAHIQRMFDLGVSRDRLVGMNDGEEETIGSITIYAIKAAHEFFHQTSDGLFPFLGFVMLSGGKTIYHAGDTLWWEGLQARLRRWTIDVAMVPINGRDAKRYASDIIGNMTYQEAADLVGGLDVKLVVPAHYDMFAFNAEDPSLFRDYIAVKYPALNVWVGEPTKQVTF